MGILGHSSSLPTYTAAVALGAALALLLGAYLGPLRVQLGQKVAWVAHEPMASFNWDDCGPRDPQVLVYNRIPKAGSTTVITLLRKLAVANDFDFVLPVPYYNHTAALEPILTALASGRPTLVCNHFNFPELLYGGGRVAYVNIMRQPVDRCASWYYYTRYGDRSRAWKEEVLARYGNASLDECLARPPDEHEQCFNCPPSEQAMAFCGRDGGDCERIEPAEALRRAWSNIQSHYFVGVTEHFSETVAMLEAMYPRFFAGAGDMLAALRPQKVTHTRAEFVEPSAETRTVAEEWTAVDMQLYDRVLAQFWRMHERCSSAGVAVVGV